MPNINNSDTNEEQNEPDKTNAKNVESGEIQVRIPAAIIKLFANPLIPGLASKYPLITNIFFTLFLAITGIDILKTIHSPDDQIDQEQVCKNYQSLLHLNNDSDSIDEVSHLPKDDGNSTKKTPQFRCLYKIKEANSPNFYTKEIQVNIQPVIADLISPEPYDESQIDMDKVCNDPDTYKSRLPINEKAGDQILRKEAKLSKNREIWSIFRWQCEYEYQTKRVNGEFDEKNTKQIGVDLDKYCRAKFPTRTKASHHDYNDPDSLYCTRPHYSSR